ncbi:hypothetical protein [Kitasatospora sp. MAA19]|uniref:hypothetical protein n=1 Tax=Kitasatospora sp. MAA19 TaxID=3035090 RepID=UPI0024770DC7|nr:hypothetical protein [Kitasatospora sp. MAA19]
MSTDTPPPLPPEYTARFCMANADLARAREIDLLTIPLPRLVHEFGSLISALDDALQLVRDIAMPRDGEDEAT